MRSFCILPGSVLAAKGDPGAGPYLINIYMFIRKLPGLDQFWQQRATQALNVHGPVLLALGRKRIDIRNGFVPIQK